jgi:hypothetical protein
MQIKRILLRVTIKEEIKKKRGRWERESEVKGEMER